MSTFNLQIKTDNAAFDPKECEVIRILRDIARKIEKETDSGIIMDFNSNRVGSYYWNPDISK